MSDQVNASGKARPVYIEGFVYPSATAAAAGMGMSLPTLYSRLHATTSTWSEWRYNDDLPVGVRKPQVRTFVNWVAYTLTHVPSGMTYVGMTGNFVRRKADHRHRLSQQIHNTPALQALYNADPDWSHWRWNALIVETKEEAATLEQERVDSHLLTGTLLNGSRTASAPIVDNMKALDYRQKFIDGVQAYIDKNRETVSKRATEILKERWSSTSARKAWEGAGNPFAKKVKVDGVVYGSVKDAQRELRINEKTIRTRARDPNYPNYTFDV